MYSAHSSTPSATSSHRTCASRYVSLVSKRNIPEAYGIVGVMHVVGLAAVSEQLAGSYSHKDLALFETPHALRLGSQGW